jgi:hypothetical protein
VPPSNLATRAQSHAGQQLAIISAPFGAPVLFSPGGLLGGAHHFSNTSRSPTPRPAAARIVPSVERTMGVVRDIAINNEDRLQPKNDRCGTSTPLATRNGTPVKGRLVPS